MKKLLNTLYITSEDAYLSLDGENIVITRPNEKDGRVPLCALSDIVCFSYVGASPKLMGKCMQENISLSFLSPQGRFLGRVQGKVKGNVFTRKAQIELFEKEEVKLKLVQNTVANKLLNTKYLIDRSRRDYKELDENGKLSLYIAFLKEQIIRVYESSDIDVIRGIEGECAKDYFGLFKNLIRNEQFAFSGRSKRPPMDEVNACLSFFYTLESLNIASTLETAGIDPYIGYFHTLRSGRASLALDIVEEFRSSIDRFTLSLINRRMINKNDFRKEITEGVFFTDEGKKKILQLWQEKKKEDVTYPYLGQKVQCGLLPFLQANVLGKFLRGEIEEYIPYCAK